MILVKTAVTAQHVKKVLTGLGKLVAKLRGYDKLQALCDEQHVFFDEPHKMCVQSYIYKPKTNKLKLLFFS